MTEEDTDLLNRYEAAQVQERCHRAFEQLTFTCSPDPSEFWRPRPGLRLAFGCVQSEAGSLRSPAYVIEFIEGDDGWVVSLIGSRDSELATNDGRLALPLSTFQGWSPKCPTDVSPIRQRLWLRLYEHYKPQLNLKRDKRRRLGR